MSDTLAHRILVTGASGFVGQHVVRALAAGGHTVVAVEHRTPLPPSVRACCENVLSADLCQPGFSLSAVKNIDRVCHLAAHLPQDRTDPAHAEICYRVNALATRELAAAAVAEGVSRFIYMSTAGLYVNAHHPAGETDCIFPADVAPYYLVSKWAGEVLSTHATEKSDTALLILRTAIPYGPGEPDRSVIATLMHRASGGQVLHVFHDGEPAYNYIYIDDLVRYVLGALETGEPGIYNVGSGEHTKLAGVATTMAELFDGRPAIEFLPRTEHSPCGFPAVSIDKAEKTWAVNPMPLHQGLARYRRYLDEKAVDS